MDSPAPSRAHLRLVVDTAAEALPDTANWVAGVLRGDPAAAGAIWDHHHELVRGLLRRLVGVRQDTEDDVQEVFLRVFALLRKLRDPLALRSFIVGITIRIARKKLTHRWRMRWLTLTESGALPQPTAAGPDFTDDQYAKEALRRIDAILGRMKPDERMAFVLRHIEGLPLPEVAAGLEVSLATAKRRLSKAQARVRRAMEQDPWLAPYLEGEHAPF